MREFRSYRRYRDFAYQVTRHWRYSLHPDKVEFLRTVLETSISRQEVITANGKLYRAQVGHDWRDENCGGLVQQVPCPFKPDRMKPCPDRALEGRANAKGIPCLYAATRPEIAVGEMRPWIGMRISLATLELKREVRVVNCSTGDKRLPIYFDEPPPEERARAVWRDIDRAFTRPVDRCDDLADYAPTQMVAEYFRENGLDGVAYSSALAPDDGHNLALFDTSTAEVVSCRLAEIKGVKLQFTLAPN